MRTKTLHKLLWKDQPKSLFYGGLIGMLIGLSTLLISIQLFFDLKTTIDNDEELLSSDYLVINKHVSVLNLSTKISSSFNENEIDNLVQQDFIKDLGRFVNNQFKVSALMEAGDENPGFYTELFFEAVDDRFLDIDTERWKWDEEIGFIPVIIPRSYLTLYNFGFAESQNLPQISESLLSMADFEVYIHTPQGKKKYRAGVVGLSDRLNSIIVPMDFIQWANAKYGKGKAPKTSRIVLETEKIGSEELLSYLEKNGYQTAKENKTNAKIVALFNIFKTTVFIIGLIIVILASFVFALSYQLILNESQPTIKSLLSIGIKRKSILGVHSTILIISTVVISIISIGIFVLMKYFYTEAISQFGFQLNQGVHPFVVLFLLIFALGWFVLSHQFTKRKIAKQFLRL